MILLISIKLNTENFYYKGLFECNHWVFYFIVLNNPMKMYNNNDRFLCKFRSSYRTSFLSIYGYLFSKPLDSKVLKKLIILLISILNFNCSARPQNISFFVDRVQKPFAEDFLNKSKVQFSNKNSVIFIIKNDHNIHKLEYFLTIQIARIEQCYTNLINVNTISYKKRIIQLQDDGSFLISENSNQRYLFEPTHPDAIRTGSAKGYITYPDINVAEELYNLKSNISLYNSLTSLINKENNTSIPRESFDNYIKLLNYFNEVSFSNLILQLISIRTKE
ncbi:hypothetical protein [Leptospira interrogans]|uniref:Uncharacterized protein n=2 Tax=Leptospira interrogans TaxID=173 RepID=M6HMU4_LEPIR|nr:hypothetical protein [Leptospira interrogans]EMM96274.1 hypothetical protein LEP1GSC158_3155 [Leptospira interrogans serovar Zanoni str. LT2156]OAM76622.1 flagellin biosynthesis protein FlgC [Leptospira interrogans serovar Bataviae]QOI37546.1 flagellin biosynthesis protein FlgC [Leptospira interrogans serovar Bataviae]QYY61128.1 flagellin biosynthesis protein FlgC [Leptospira interrogans serovar Bataviae]